MTLRSRLKANASGSPRPPSHRSRSSCRATIATSGFARHRQEGVAQSSALELEREQRHLGSGERARTIADVRVGKVHDHPVRPAVERPDLTKTRHSRKRLNRAVAQFSWHSKAAA